MSAAAQARPRPIPNKIITDPFMQKNIILSNAVVILYYIQTHIIVGGVAVMPL